MIEWNCNWFLVDGGNQRAVEIWTICGILLSVAINFKKVYQEHFYSYCMSDRILYSVELKVY